MRRAVPRSPRPGSRLALCASAVLALHAVVLWSAGPASRHFGPGQALSVRSILVGDQRELAAPAPLQALGAARLDKLTALASTSSLPSSLADHSDAAAPLLSYPDATLPGAQAHARVALSVEHDGYVRELAVEPKALPPAFENAVQRAFSGSLLAPEQRSGLRADGRLCVEVKFQEGEPPSWQPVAPTGICVG